MGAMFFRKHTCHVFQGNPFECKPSIASIGLIARTSNFRANRSISFIVFTFWILPAPRNSLVLVSNPRGFLVKNFLGEPDLHSQHAMAYGAASEVRIELCFWKLSGNFVDCCLAHGTAGHGDVQKTSRADFGPSFGLLLWNDWLAACQPGTELLRG